MNSTIESLKNKLKKKGYYNYKRTNRYNGSDKTVFDQALADARLQIQFQEANPKKALPIGL